MRPPKSRLVPTFVLCLFLLPVSSCREAGETEILWDSYGVPHIFADTPEDLVRAHGWAQMESHGDLILRLYGQARGSGAEYWGRDYLDSDIWARVNSIPRRAADWWGQQDPEMARLLRAFVDGMNEYAADDQSRIGEEVRVVLPVTPVDVIAHLLRSIHFNFVANPGVAPRSLQEEMVGRRLSEPLSEKGSNAWAIGPSRSASGNAMLLANPHLPWSDLFTWYESHLVGPDFDAYGANLVGIPLLVIGFTDHLGWTHTVNTHDGADVFELTLQDGGYLFDGEVRAFDVRMDTLRVKGEDGSMAIRTLTIRSSVHGPVIAEAEDRALALRVVGLDDPFLFRQYYEMLSAENLEEFESAMRPIQIPMFTTMYADRDGHIMHLFNGRVPRRGQGDFAYWMGAVPGNTSETLWSEYHPYEDLPKVIDPASGWLQNANDPPWTTTFPEALSPADFPAYMAPQSMHPRAQRSARMLLDDETVSFDGMVEDKFSTRMELADRLLDDLIPAARELGGDGIEAAADILEAWDRSTDADSRGAVLFLNWAMALYAETRGNPYAVPWSPDDALNTPDGLADPRRAAEVLGVAADTTLTRHGALDVPFGDVYRVRRDGVDLPGNGMSDPAGVFRAAWYQPSGDGTQTITGGDTFVLAVEFSDPIRAVAVLGYGNASQPGSPHRTDQLSLFSEKRVRPVLRTRSEIESGLEKRTVLPTVSMF